MYAIRSVRMHALLCAAALPIAHVAPEAAAQSADSDGSYIWSAELVSFDEAAGTMTVKARIENHAEIDNAASFSEGDRLTLVWTGRSWAAGVRDLTRSGESAEGPLTLPVEFVSFESDGSYVNFRVPVPDEAAQKVGSLEEGGWLRAASPRGATDWSNAVSAVTAPYSAAERSAAAG